MNKTTRRLLAMLLCMLMVFGSTPAIGAASLLGLQASAADAVSLEQYGNLYYAIDQIDGSSYASVRFCEPKTVGEVMIPATLGGYPVKEIGSYAFAACTEITSVIIPASVEWIGSTAFYDCKSLKQITLPNGLTDIGNWAFYGCAALETLTLPNTLNVIRDGAFMDCTALKSISIPDSVTMVGDFAFAGCSSLTSVDYCPTDYYYLSDDEKLNLEYCLGELLWVGGGRANGLFQDCSAIRDIRIGSGVLFFDFYDFIGHPALQNFTVDADNIIYSSQDGVLFDKDKTILLAYPAANPRTEYVIPDSVLTGFMQYANNLKTLTIGANFLSNAPFINGSGDESDEGFFAGLAYSCLAFNNNIETYKVSSRHPFFTADDFGVLYIKGEVPDFGEYRMIFAYPLGKSEDTIYVMPDNVPLNVMFPWMLVKASEKDSRTGLRRYEPAKIKVHASVEQLAMLMSTYTETEVFVDPENETTMEHEALLSELTENNMPLSFLRFSRICVNATNEEIKSYFLTNLGDEKYYNKLQEILHTDFSNDLAKWISLTELYINSPSEDEIEQNKSSLYTEFFSYLLREPDVTKYDQLAVEWTNAHKDILEEAGMSISSENIPEDINLDEFKKDIKEYGRVYSILMYGLDLYQSPANLMQRIYEDKRATEIENIASNMGSYLSVAEGVLRTEPGELIYCDGNHGGHVHTFGDWITIKEPTETEEGLKERVCTECGEKEQQKIDKIQTVTKKDDASGIQVSFINTVLDSNVVLRVENVQDGAAFNLIQGDNIEKKAVFDITLLKDGVEVQPNGSVTVRIPIPAGFNASLCKLYHISLETMSIEEIPVRIEGNYLVFTTTHFSLYAIAETKASDPVKPVIVKLDKNTITMTYKTTSTLIANIENGEGATVVWTSSNEKVAIVDQSGKVSATGKGTATITCTVTDNAGNAVKDSSAVTVKYTWWQWLIVILLFGWIWY